MRTTKQGLNKKRSVAMTAALLAVGLIVGIGPAQAQPKAKAKHNPPPITIRGGFINDLNCVPTALGTTADPQVYTVDCTASSAWTGDLTGREFVHFHATVTTSGRVDGTWEGVFVGTYAGDNSYGGLRTVGSFSVDENNQFLGSATISGTCAWAGSTGSMSFSGLSVIAEPRVNGGGYEGTWQRPAVAPAADPTCNPFDGWVP